MKRNFLVLIILVISILSLSCESAGISKSLTKNKYNNTKTVKGKENRESLIEYGDSSVYAVHFPTFAQERIDKYIKGIIDNYIAEFQQRVKNNSTKHIDKKSELNIDYDIGLINDNIVNIEFSISIDHPYYSMPEDIIETIVYDLSSQQFIILEDDKLNYPEVSGQSNGSLTVNNALSLTEKEVVRLIDSGKPMVALTFDDGPNIRTTLPILETLNSNGAVATFFVLGNRVKQNKELVLRMIENGNEIGNHTYNHRLLTTISNEELNKQIDRTQNIISEVTGVEPVVMRPTYGAINNRLKENINMPIILWSVDTMDWKSKDAKAISKHILNNIKDGDIVLMHDIYLSTVDAVKIVIPELIKRGYQLVTVSELIKEKGASLQAGSVYRHYK